MTAITTTTNPFPYPHPNNRPNNDINNNVVHGQFYSHPQIFSFFNFNEAGTRPTDSLQAQSAAQLAIPTAAQLAIPTAGGDYSWSQSDAWDTGNTSGFGIDTDLSSYSSYMQQHRLPGPGPGGMAPPWVMDDYEQIPVGSTTWTVAGSPSSFTTHGSPTSARPTSQSNARTTTPSGSRRPSLARYHSSSTTTFKLSPASTIEPTNIQRESRAEPERPGRPSKRRKSGHEPQESEKSSRVIHQQQQHPTAEVGTPMALSVVPTPSPQNTSVVPDFSPDSHTSASPRYQEQDFPTHQQPDYSTHQQQHQQQHHQQSQLQQQPQQQQQSPGDYHTMTQLQTGFVPPSQLPPSQQPQPQALRERNRAAANKCRRKSKAVVADLESAERDLDEEHRQLSQTAGGLREEVLALKSALLLHGHCEDEVIQQYFANSARIVGSAQGQAAQAQLGGGSSSYSGLPGSGSRGRPPGHGATQGGR